MLAPVCLQACTSSVLQASACQACIQVSLQQVSDWKAGRGWISNLTDWCNCSMALFLVWFLASSGRVCNTCCHCKTLFLQGVMLWVAWRQVLTYNCGPARYTSMLGLSALSIACAWHLASGKLQQILSRLHESLTQ